MKTNLLFILTLLSATPATARETALQTDSVKMLRGLTVNGVHMEQKTDRRLLFPSKALKGQATDGYELLKRLHIPGIQVNLVEQKITSTRKGTIQIRINDVEASAQDISALCPDEVIRVEYIENPGVRYAGDNLDAVINYVVKRRYAGYVAGLYTMQALATGLNNSNVYVKYNHKLSEFSLDYTGGYRRYNKEKTDSYTSYLFPDGTVRHRDYQGFNSTLAYDFHYLQAGYNLAKPDKYQLNVRLNFDYNHQPYRGPIQRTTEAGEKDKLQYLRIYNAPKIPSFDIYYAVRPPKRQHIIANAVGTYISTDYQYTLHEYLFDKSLEETLKKHPTNDYSYSTVGKKYSLISEAIYTKQFKTTALSAGSHYTISHTNNQYSGSVQTDAVLNANNLYLFAQLQGKWGLLNYQIGAGANYISIRLGGTGFDKWTFRPQLTLSANASQAVSIRYTGRITPSIPSLADLSNVRQQRNDLQVNDGNPALVPYNSYKNTLTVTWTQRLFALALYGTWTYAPKKIMSSISPIRQQDGAWLIAWQKANQKRYSYYYTNAELTLHAIPDKLDLTMFGDWNRYESRGLDYAQNYTYWNYGGSLNLILGHWSMDYYFMTDDHWLDGESIQNGENESQLSVSYKCKGIKATIGCSLLGYAKGYDYMTQTVSRYYKDENHTSVRDNGNMVFISLSWHFSHGRTYKTTQRQLDNRDKDNGIK